MTDFVSDDLVPLWNRPPSFLPLSPPSGSYHWSHNVVRSELQDVASSTEKAVAERRVALLSNPSLNDESATDGLHAGIQMLRPGESAAAHRHSPAALRIGIEGRNVATLVDDEEQVLDPLDVILNPSGTWHGHTERGGVEALWLDVVDLPLVAALGGVHFEPSTDHQRGDLLDPESIPKQVRFPWNDTAAQLDVCDPVDGVRTASLGGGEVLPTMAVTAYAIETGATLRLPARTAGAVVLIGEGAFTTPAGLCDRFDVVALRSWTPFELTATAPGVVLITDTSPTLRKLGLYREER